MTIPIYDKDFGFWKEERKFCLLVDIFPERLQESVKIELCLLLLFLSTDYRDFTGTE